MGARSSRGLRGSDDPRRMREVVSRPPKTSLGKADQMTTGYSGKHATYYSPPTEPDILETVDLFLNGDGSGIGGRDLIQKMATEIKAMRVRLNRAEDAICMIRNIVN